MAIDVRWYLRKDKHYPKGNQHTHALFFDHDQITVAGTKQNE